MKCLAFSREPGREGSLLPLCMGRSFWIFPPPPVLSVLVIWSDGRTNRRAMHGNGRLPFGKFYGLLCVVLLRKVYFTLHSVSMDDHDHKPAR